MIQSISVDLQDVLNVIDTLYYKKLDYVDCYIKIQNGGLSNCLDPYSTYVTAKERADMEVERLDPTYFGVGIRMIFGVGDKLCLLIPMSDTISIETGVKAGDMLLSINDQPIFGLESDSVRKIIIEGLDTFSITVNRDGKKIGPLHLTRKLRYKTDVVFEKIDSTLARIYLFGFNAQSYVDLENTLRRVRKEIKSGSFILDLRYNPGGNTGSTINIIHLFARDSNRLVVTLKNTNTGWVAIDSVKKVGEFHDLNFVILNERRTASAAELFSGVMKSWKRAPIVGDTTFGKGVGQRYVLLPSGNFLHLSVFEMFLGDSANVRIQGVGIPPDYFIVNKPPSSKMIFRDDEFHTAVKVIKRTIH
ncbi:MAG: S41 family peptidase [Patescibacteria group bacterium]